MAKFDILGDADYIFGRRSTILVYFFLAINLSKEIIGIEVKKVNN